MALCGINSSAKKVNSNMKEGTLITRHLTINRFYYIILLFIFASFTNREVKVVYLWHQHRFDNLPEKKLKTTVITEKNGIQEKSEDSLSLNQMGRFISFSGYITIYASFKSSYSLPNFNEISTHIKINTPDTLFYKNQQWSSVKDGVITSLPLITISYDMTDEHKKILGYDCIKFNASNDLNKEYYEIWACKTLPKTLLPIAGLKEFKYGILEMKEKSGLWDVKAIEID